MKNNFRKKLTGAFGFPIDENPSPIMYEAAYAAMNLDWRYQLIEVHPKNLEAAINGIRAMQFEGVNLTIPHKVAAVPYMDELSESAKIIGAINTIINRDGKLIGDNTDGKGFVMGMEKNGVKLADKHIVILGSGGAARAISVESALAGCASIIIVARNEVTGGELKELLDNATPCKAGFVKWTPGVHIPKCDVLINATNVGLYPDSSKPNICYDDIHPDMIVQDIIPNPAWTPFLDQAKKCGATTFDGQSMLVYQGALAVEMWTGKKPPVQDMIDALKNVFSN